MAVVAPMFPDDNSILEQMCQPAIQTILNFENSRSIRIEQKNAGESMVEKKKKVLGTEYHVTVQYGQERLEKCVENMLRDKEKKIRMTDCNYRKRSI